MPAGDPRLNKRLQMSKYPTLGGFKLLGEVADADQLASTGQSLDDGHGEERGLRSIS
jgi:hypothetical protein